MLDRRSLILAGTAALVLPATRGVGHAAMLVAAPRGDDVVNVRNLGAKGDGTTIDTAAINRAIDHAAARGGGTVYFRRAPTPATRSG